MDITVFEEIYSLATEEIRDVQVSLREFKKMDYDQQLVDAGIELQEATSEYTTASAAEAEVKKSIAKLSGEILNKSKNLRQTISPVDVDQLMKESGSLVKALTDNHTLLENLDPQTETNKQTYLEVANEIAHIDLDLVNSKATEYYDSISTKDSTDVKLRILLASAKQKKTLVQELENHSYDPDCSYCVDNPFVKQAQQAKVDLASDKIDADEYSKKIAKLQTTIEDLLPHIENKSRYDTLKVRLGDIKNNQLGIKVDRTNIGSKINNLESTMAINANKISEYRANKRDLKHNEIIANEISIIESDLAIATENLDDLQSSIKQKHTQRALARTIC